MTRTLSPATLRLKAFQEGAPQRPAHRVLLVSRAHFEWLRMLQARAPAPRIDLRYLVEGALALVQQDAALQVHWLREAREALYAHVASQHEANQNEAPPEHGGVHTESAADPGARHLGVMALHAGEAPFQWLKAVQKTTSDPRLEIRYLVEGVIALLRQNADLLPRAVVQARRALCEHLTQLEQQPLETFRLEINT